MASVNYEKLKSPQEVKAVLRHCDKDERLKHEHANKEIDKALTGNNEQTRGYSAACAYYDDRIELLDSQEGANKRRDRVTAFALCVPCPAAVPDELRSEFFELVRELVSQQYGAGNIVGAYFHRDERHAYARAVEVDRDELGAVTNSAIEMRESLDHAHIIVIPEIAGKLNGKKFSSAAQMKKLNRAIDKACQAQFGCDFMNGSRRSSNEDIETLKGRSRELELELREQQLERHAQHIEKRATETREQRQQLGRDIDKANELIHELDGRERRLNAREEGLNAREEALGKREAKLYADEQAALTAQARAADEINARYDDIGRRYRALGKDEEAQRAEEAQKTAAETLARSRAEQLKQQRAQQLVDNLRACAAKINGGEDEDTLTTDQAAAELSNSL